MVSLRQLGSSSITFITHKSRGQGSSVTLGLYTESCRNRRDGSFELETRYGDAGVVKAFVRIKVPINGKAAGTVKRCGLGSFYNFQHRGGNSYGLTPPGTSLKCKWFIAVIFEIRRMYLKLNSYILYENCIIKVSYTICRVILRVKAESWTTR